MHSRRPESQYACTFKVTTQAVPLYSFFNTDDEADNALYRSSVTV